nr:MAG TPA: hypothetical protein [Caudoviricetes sp.]
MAVLNYTHIFLHSLKFRSGTMWLQISAPTYYLLESLAHSTL